MTYPPPLYDGETAELSATVRLRDATPELTYPDGNRVHYLATGDSTGGLFGLYRWEMSGSRSGPGPHFHRTMSESFYILSGEVRIYDGEWKTAHAGDFLHVPPGGVHGFRNESGEPASMLLHFAPGAPREAYFEGLARLANGEQMSAEEFTGFLQEHDNLYVE
jgi:mannose-6-phosphate isomerase-like protein (cupin superfamily)